MIEINNLTLQYDKVLLDKQCLEIKEKSITLIHGPSGCGKTTLLYYLGLFYDLENDYIYHGKNISKESEEFKANLRKKEFGFLFQNYILFDEYSIYENFEYFARLTNSSISEDKARVLLQQVRVDEDIHRNLYTLSGGQKQRVALACLLIKDPKVLLLDEPTSALDKENSVIILEILEQLKKDKTIVIVSHDQMIKEYSDEIICFENKKLVVQKHTKKTNSSNEIPIKTTLNKSFYTFYNKKYKSKKKNNFKIICFAIAMLLLTSVGVFNITNSYIDSLKQENVSSSNLAQVYIQETMDVMDYDIYKSYPYYEVSIELLDNMYAVLPIYPETNQTSSNWMTIDYIPELEFSISFDLFYLIEYVYVPTTSISTNLYSNTVSSEFNYAYTNILLNGYQYGYTDSTYFVTLPYDYIESSLSDNEKGMTLFFDDYDSLTFFIEENQDKVVDISFNQLDEVIETIQLFSTLKYVFVLMTLVFGEAALFYLYKTYIKNRYEELALLKAIGLSNKEVNYLLLEELQLPILISFITISIVQLLMRDIYAVLFLFFISIGLEIMISLILHYYVKKINPVKVFRT